MTFHVRLVSPPDQTKGLVGLLTADSGVSNLVVLPGTAQRPDGDAVQFDVRSGSANSVFRELKAFQADHSGTVGVKQVDATLGEETAPASKHFFVQRDVAPVWDIVEARIRSDAVYAPSFYVLLAIAGLIGAVGILALLAGFSAAIVVTLIFGLLIRWSGHTPERYRAGVRPVSALIDNPNLFSVVVAVLAGIVGVVSLTEARTGALIGVFISVTTIPAAADIGLSFAYSSWEQARGSCFQLLLNVFVLIAVGTAALRLQRIIWRARAASGR
jgi:hypothetical protein